MNEKFVDRLAERMARQYIKETTFATQKWEKMTPAERSLWRLLARAAAEMVLQEIASGTDLRAPAN
jgi:hypothetical protein